MGTQDLQGRSLGPVARRRRGAAALLSLSLVAVVSAACGPVTSAVPPTSTTRPAPSGGSGTVFPSTTAPAGGSTSPKAAADSFWTALGEGNTSDACRFVLPDQHAACRSTFKYGSGGVAHPGVGNDIVYGDRAIVVLEATQSCWGFGQSTTTTSCFTNTNPDKGLPASNRDFDAAWQYAYFLFGVIACQEYDGGWFVSLEAALGEGGGTGATGVTGSGATGTTGPTSTQTTIPAGPTGTGTTIPFGTTGTGVETTVPNS